MLCEVVPKVDPQVLAGRGTLDLDRVAELGREHVGARKYLQQVEEPLGRAGGFAAGRVGCFVGCHSDSLRPLYVRSTYRSCSAGDALAVSHSCMGSGVECALNVRDEGAEPGSYPSQSIDNLRPHVMVRNERVVRDLGSHPLHRTLPTRSRRIQTPTTPRIMKSRFPNMKRLLAGWSAPYASARVGVYRTVKQIQATRTEPPEPPLAGASETSASVRVRT